MQNILSGIMENRKKKKKYNLCPQERCISSTNIYCALSFLHMPGTLQIVERKSNIYYLLKQEEKQKQNNSSIINS